MAVPLPPSSKASARIDPLPSKASARASLPPVKGTGQRVTVGEETGAAFTSGFSSGFKV